MPTTTDHTSTGGNNDDFSRLFKARPRPDDAYHTLRIGETDRQAVADRLCKAFGEGRLSEDELNERLSQAATAKTQADLDPLLADLPRNPEDGQAAGQPPSSNVPYHHRDRGPGGPHHSHPLIKLIVLLVVIGAALHLTFATVHFAAHLIGPAFVIAAVAVLVLLRRSRRRPV